ncbi:endonuclease III [Clostridium estertheticum]|uniref:Endonuclease III n=1 Tax=Clostridium estertheticum subsp. estertheticum TaxID=1552 RepID=A0A1J0GM88_9CLOT|nr:endonuclease III [Clostridium estertheticum]APC42530.1 endonuclease III [Clostridium estertheticum subsp. estertheticum]MBU3074569.1 endonuclease III [Clostridium estertheticum]MBU3164719.1 endonuclease III [Clostridium estertheticum]MBZ9615242.1 endonuclease III [Clostridium estertheticum subsp. laramiense]WAG75988.1 endonuclease III [Clostridium estertheticum]
MNKKTIKVVLEILNETYTGVKCGLDFTNHYELLVSTILSAQCTDVRVNVVAKKLYAKYNTPEAMITLSKEELGEKIKSCGFYNNKSKNILGATKLLLEKYGGVVPRTMEELIQLPGVGRKTANVVLSNAFGIPAIAVDTHVFRVSKRIGLASGKNVEIVEQELMKNIPRKMWSDAHHFIIWHGREICKARKPNCEVCPIAPYCEFLNGKSK